MNEHYIDHMGNSHYHISLLDLNLNAHSNVSRNPFVLIQNLSKIEKIILKFIKTQIKMPKLFHGRPGASRDL